MSSGKNLATELNWPFELIANIDSTNDGLGRVQSIERGCESINCDALITSVRCDKDWRNTWICTVELGKDLIKNYTRIMFWMYIQQQFDGLYGFVRIYIMKKIQSRTNIYVDIFSWSAGLVIYFTNYGQTSLTFTIYVPSERKL